MARPWIVGWIALGIFGCGGAGRYGYARAYVPLSDEEGYTRRAREAIYDEVRRLPHRYENQLISWFGVVQNVDPAQDGSARVSLQIRTHQERHLCEEPEENTCRVTVSDQNGGPFTALLRIAPEDREGENRLQAGSLVRVYGTVVQGEHDAQGGPLLRVQYYRHWPRGQFVTTALRDQWRH